LGEKAPAKGLDCDEKERIFGVKAKPPNEIPKARPDKRMQ
jgi:hypothetical protein